MTRSVRAATLAGAVLGMGIGLLVVLRDGPRPVQAARSQAPRLAKHRLAANELPLSESERKALGRWFREFRGCMVERGFALPAPTETARALLIELPSGLATRPPPAPLLRAQLACAEGQGGPPHATSFVLADGALRLYKPRACILPVAKER